MSMTRTPMLPIPPSFRQDGVGCERAPEHRALTPRRDTSGHLGKSAVDPDARDDDIVRLPPSHPIPRQQQSGDRLTGAGEVGMLGLARGDRDRADAGIV
jgi:hypothetical protein